MNQTLPRHRQPNLLKPLALLLLASANLYAKHPISISLSGASEVPPIITQTKSGNNGFVLPPDTKLNEAQYRSYIAGNLYINVHCSQYPDGEIRGQFPRTGANWSAELT